MDSWMSVILPLLVGWTLDLLLGDPAWLPHPIVWFGKTIATFERHLNKGKYRKAKGAFTAVFLIALVFIITGAIAYGLRLTGKWSMVNGQWSMLFDAIIIFHLNQEDWSVYSINERLHLEGLPIIE